MTTVLPAITLTPFRNHVDRARADLWHLSRDGSQIPRCPTDTFPPRSQTQAQYPLQLPSTKVRSTFDDVQNSTPSKVVYGETTPKRLEGGPTNQGNGGGKTHEHMYYSETLTGDPGVRQQQAIPDQDRYGLADESRIQTNQDRHGSRSVKQCHIGPLDPVNTSDWEDMQEILTPFPKLEADAPGHEPVTYMTPTAIKRHRYRISDASSVFVRTIKTASMSNGSFSIYHRSSVPGKSSDTQSFAFPPRCSTDSDRLGTTASEDEAALSRATRRKRIFIELVATEESYVADLKALLYLYSTLLAKNTSLSSSTCTAIQRNVAELLHLHEGVLEKLHLAAFRGAARKWADTALPTRLGRSHHTRWRSIGPHPRTRYLRRNGGHRTSIESSRSSCDNDRAGSADAVDVLDLTAIFEALLPSLFVYEEYCANHETITNELHKQTTVLWSTFEAGLESLARVLTAIDQKPLQSKKGLTVGDLLIKPIQRICRYPLLLGDLLRQMPLMDGPGAHEALQNVLLQLRETVNTINAATDDHNARLQIQKRVMLQDRLNLEAINLSTSTFRGLGQIYLCGVLHIVYRTLTDTCGCYALCVLFDNHFLIALPKQHSEKFDLFALINLDELTTRPSDDGNGLQCSSAHFTFKVCFLVQDYVHEVMLSACSAVEEQQWARGLEGDFRSSHSEAMLFSTVSTQSYISLKPTARTLTSGVPLSRQSSIQRAATIGNRPPICQIILRNTHNLQDLQEYRTSSVVNVGRSLSHATSVKTVVLAPKRSERAKLEGLLIDVWTKDKLPYPGMIVNKGSQILRASAGTLVRKLSLVSIQAPFSRRSTSTTVSSKKSYDAITERRKDPPMFTIRRPSSDNSTPIRSKRPKEIPELDTMDSVIGRMIGGSSFGAKRLSFSGGHKTLSKGNKAGQRTSVCRPSPDDPAAVFYDDDNDKDEDMEQHITVEFPRPSDLSMKNTIASAIHVKKRWSNPISKLKGLKTEGLKNILHSTK